MSSLPVNSLFFLSLPFPVCLSKTHGAYFLYFPFSAFFLTLSFLFSESLCTWLVCTVNLAFQQSKTKKIIHIVWCVNPGWSSLVPLASQAASRSQASCPVGLVGEEILPEVYLKCLMKIVLGSAYRPSNIWISSSACYTICRPRQLQPSSVADRQL